MQPPSLPLFDPELYGVELFILQRLLPWPTKKHKQPPPLPLFDPFENTHSFMLPPKSPSNSSQPIIPYADSNFVLSLSVLTKIGTCLD